MTSPTFRVRCSDGSYRHAQAFGTFAEAQQFAEWGHACTTVHTIESDSTEVPTEVEEMCERTADAIDRATARLDATHPNSVERQRARLWLDYQAGELTAREYIDALCDVGLRP